MKKLEKGILAVGGLVLLCVWSILGDEILTLKDGREVRLRDNGTWEYLGASAATAPRNPFADAETREIVKKAADHMRSSLSMARMRVETTILRIQTGDRSGGGLGEASTKGRQDIDKGRVLFEQASFRLASNAKASEALNEMYIFWKSSIDQA